MISLSHATPFTLTALFVLLAVGILCFLGMVGLRFARRGDARFWMSPAATALALLPTVAGVGAADAIFVQTLDGMALTGPGGLAAVAAGSGEALVPLLLGLVLTAGLAFVGAILTAVGSSRVGEGAGRGGVVLPVAALLALGLAAVLVIQVMAAIDALNGDHASASSVATLSRFSAVAAAALGLLLLALALATPFLAPRRPSPLGVKLVALAWPALSGLAALAGAWFVQGSLQCLSTTAATGAPCNALPEVALQAPLGEAQAAPEPPPPPPPRPPGPKDSAPAEGVHAVRGGGIVAGAAGEEAEGTALTAETGSMRPVRVGGEIQEPRKLKSVAPDYPDIAKRARVQGVVILEATISPQGRVTQVKVLRGIPLLDQAAIDAVRQWVYTPTLLNGVPVPVIMTITVNFKLS